MNRVAARLTEGQREFLAAHDEVARTWRDSIGPDGFIVRGAIRFSQVQAKLYSLAPWETLGIDAREFANPNRQAYGR